MCGERAEAGRQRGGQHTIPCSDRRWNGDSKTANHPIANLEWPDFPILTQPPPKYQGRVKDLVEDLRGRVKRGESVIFVVPTSGKVDRLREILKDYEIPYDRVTESSDKRRVTSDERVANSSDRSISRSADRQILSRPRASSLPGARFAKAWPFPS